jgi:hypothetical protein
VGQLVLDGSLTLGPGEVTDGTFPAATSNEPLSATPNPKLFNAGTGILQRLFNNPSGFAALSGVGTGDTVLQANALYFKCGPATIKLRLTFADPDGGSDIVSVVPVSGTVFMEFPANGYLKLLEAKGSATIVYFLVGLQ